MLKIKTPARIHFGQLDLNGDLGRIYGGSGVGVKEPYTLIYFEKSTKLEVEGNNNIKNIAEDFLHSLKKENLLAEDAAIKINVEKLLPAHCGLGSGTQIGLSIAEAVNHLYDLNLKEKRAANLVNRKHSRSAIGFGAFYQGGFIVDGGRPTSQKKNDNYLPPILFRKEIPENWHFIIIILNEASDKVAGKKEIKIFNNIEKMQLKKSAENCHHLVLGMLPALAENNLSKFAKHLNIIEDNVANYFAHIQGGKYSSPCSEELIDLMEREGIQARGQSSWGPSLYGIAGDKEKLLKIKRKLENEYSTIIKNVYITKAANSGAEISLVQK